MTDKKGAGHHLGVYFRASSSREGFRGVSSAERGSSESEPELPLEILVMPHTHADLCWRKGLRRWSILQINKRKEALDTCTIIPNH